VSGGPGATSPGSLDGRRVLITRRWPELAIALRAAGATVTEVPAIEIRPPADPGPLDRALAELARYDWLVFTSANAVEAVASRMSSHGEGLPPALRIASVGPATTEAVGTVWREARVELQPTRDFRGSGLVEAFAAHDLAGRRVLLPVSDRAAATVGEGLSARGARVDRIIAYRTESSAGRAALRRELDRGVDGVVFASPSAVEALEAAARDGGRPVPAFAIGPTTADAVRAARLDLRATAEPSTMEGMQAAIVQVLGRPRRGSAG